MADEPIQAEDEVEAHAFDTVSDTVERHGQRHSLRE